MQLTCAEYRSKRAALSHRLQRVTKEATPLRKRLRQLDTMAERLRSKIAQLDEEEGGHADR